jgi:hypothetical protein
MLLRGLEKKNTTMISETSIMDEFLLLQNSTLYSFWLVATVGMRFEHRVVSLKRFGPNTWGHIHVTVQKWDQILTGCTAFFEVYESIKLFERRYPDCAEKYSIIVHGKHGSPKGHTQYMLGCTIKYAKFTGELKISHINRKVPALVEMLHTARFYGASFETSNDKDERLANFKRRMLEKKVFRSQN